MSTLSKVFVVLVFLIAAVFTGVVATLFAHRVDWKDKFVKEVNYHYQTQQIKNAEIAAVNLELENVKAFLALQEAKNVQLAQEVGYAQQQVRAVTHELDYNKTQLERLQATMEVLAQQLRIQNVQITSYRERVEQYRSKLVKAVNEKTTAIQELHHARQMAERLNKDLAELERNHISLAKEAREAKLRLENLALKGVDVTSPAPRAPVDGKVTAVANDIGLVVISVGREQGVMVGDEFTVYRGGAQGGQFVARVVIDRADRSWAAGRVVVRKLDPRVGDDASNHIFATGSQATSGVK